MGEENLNFINNYKSNTTGATCGAGTAYFPEHLSSSPVLRGGSRFLIFSFMCNSLQIIACPFILFLLAIVLSVLLRFTASDYPFGIYKLLLAIVLSVLLRFTASDYPSGIYNLFLGTVNLHNKPSQCQNVNEFDLIFCCWCFQQYFSYIMATSFSGG